MKFVPFYEDYLKAVILPRLAKVTAMKQPTSLADFRKKFNDVYGMNISYDHFRSWVRDLGITVERHASISMPGAVPPEPSVESAPVDYNFGKRPEPQPNPQRNVPGRGGINLSELFQ
jgi:hypothetical protein